MKRRTVLTLFLSCCFILGGINFTQTKAETVSKPIISSDFLKADGKQLKNDYGRGNIVQLKGTNAGGYMLQEFWMCPTNYSSDNNYKVNCQMDIYKTLKERFGESKMRDLVNVYEDNYWTEKDFDNCESLGINCIRLPLWYMNFVDFDGNMLDNAFDRIDWFIQEAGKRGIYVIIDMHGAPGSQNGSDHSGIYGGNNKQGESQFFWGNNAAANQQLYYNIWAKIAEHYKDNPTVAGYDLLNEPFCTYRYNSSYSDSDLHNLLWGIYDKAYDTIRNIDKNHVIIMEATWDPIDLPDPSNYGWNNVMYEYHNYLYDDYDNANGGQIENMKKKLNAITKADYNVPSYMGEFAYMNNTKAWSDGIKLLDDYGINWTTWTYKVTGTNNNWGLYNQSGLDPVNVSSDSEASIRNKWSKVGNSYPNTELIKSIKQYFIDETKSLSDGNYYISSFGNKIVTSEDGGKKPLIANKNSYEGAMESFQVINNYDGTVSLKSNANGKYVCAVLDESNQLIARSDKINDWEKFKLVKVSDSQYSLYCPSNNKYVKSDFNDSNNNGILKAVSDSISGWEAFTFNSIK
jgi:aryl-phospho-beta-D-glucosidase BglC (GH1 family)